MGSEVWKPVVGYEGLYEVSNMGRVRSVERVARFVSKTGKECTRLVRARELKLLRNKRQNRISVMFSKNNVQKRVAVHRLVAEAFCENPNGYTEVNHKDEDPTNNHADNLEWCTRYYNMNYGTMRKRVYDKNKRAIIAVNEDGDEIRFDSIRAAERSGFQKGSIYYAMDRNKQYKNFFWRYEDEQPRKRVPRRENVRKVSEGSRL